MPKNRSYEILSQTDEGNCTRLELTVQGRLFELCYVVDESVFHICIIHKQPYSEKKVFLSAAPHNNPNHKFTYHLDGQVLANNCETNEYYSSNGFASNELLQKEPLFFECIRSLGCIFDGDGIIFE